MRPILCLLAVLLAAIPVLAAEGAKDFVNAADYRTIQDAINALPDYGGTVTIPPGNYVVKETLNLTINLKKHPCTVRLVGAGRNWSTRLILDTNGQPGIDLTGNGYCSLSNLMIQNRTANVGILMSRTPEGGGGGGNDFDNLVLHGAYPIACVYSIGAEVNRWYNCTFSNQLAKYYQKDVPGMTSGDCFIFAADNLKSVKSPYVPGNSGGCNTELLIQGCTINNEGPDSVGLRIVGFANDVRVYASYLHSDGFSAITVDGIKATAGNISLRDLRIEGEDGKHCLVAQGHVRNVVIDGGSWYSNFEPIVQRDALSFTDLRYSPDPMGGAFGWSIHDAVFCIYDGVGFDTGWAGHATGEIEKKVWPEGSNYVFMRFDRLRYSDISCMLMVATRRYKDASGKVQYQTDFSGGQETLPRERLVAVMKWSEGNKFTVEKACQVLLLGKKVGRNEVEVRGG